MNTFRNIPDGLKIPVYDMHGAVVEELDVPVSRFGGRIFRDALRQALITYEANRRSGTAKTKTRAEVSYSGAKPWPQKGTGNARAGSRASTIWVGGGVAHGPKVRDHSKKLNRKVRRRALASALLCKAIDGEVKLIDRIELSQQRTREMALILKNMGVERTFLLVTPLHDQQIWRCTRNLRGASVMAAYELNAYQVVRPKDVIFTREAFDVALASLSELEGRNVEDVETETVEAG